MFYKNTGFLRHFLYGDFDVTYMASITGCAPGSFPFMYLRIPIGESMVCIKAWQVIINRFKKRLCNWKVKLHCIGGRLTLIKYVLGSLGICYLSLFCLPTTVSHLLETFRSHFFWGIEEDQLKIHWVKWDVLLSSPEHYGIDIGSLDAFNLALLYKWKWRFFNAPQAI